MKLLFCIMGLALTMSLAWSFGLYEELQHAQQFSNSLKEELKQVETPIMDCSDAN